jgi:hypothetical protein
VYGLSREIHGPRLGGAGQGNMEVVHHHRLIPTGVEDGIGVDLEELGKVDGPVVDLEELDNHSQTRGRCPG